MEGRSQEQAVKDTITGLTGAVMALAGEVCQRDPRWRARLQPHSPDYWTSCRTIKRDHRRRPS